MTHYPWAKSLDKPLCIMHVARSIYNLLECSSGWRNLFSRVFAYDNVNCMRDFVEGIYRQRKMLIVAIWRHLAMPGLAWPVAARRWDEETRRGVAIEGASGWLTLHAADGGVIVCYPLLLQLTFFVLLTVQSALSTALPYFLSASCNSTPSVYLAHTHTHCDTRGHPVTLLSQDRMTLEKLICFS